MSTLPNTVVFDLDGTLVDSGPAILEALRLALVAEGVPPLSDEVTRTLLGPPLYRSLPPLIGESAQRVVAAYRRIFVEQGFMLQADTYDGVPDMLARLTGAGARLAVATSKSEAYAVPLLESLGIADRFTTICGDTLDAGRSTKAAVIAEVADRLDSLAGAVMIGDRSHDVEGAAEHGLPCLGVTWGYGSEQELISAGAVAVVGRVDELVPALTGLIDRDQVRTDHPVNARIDL